MVSYVESATFKVIDKGSNPLATIRKALDDLNKSASDLARKGEGSMRRFGDAAIAANKRVARASSDDIARQIKTAQVEGRRRATDAARFAAMEQAARDREINSAKVDASRRKREEAAALKESERQLRESIKARERLQNRTQAAMLYGKAGLNAPIALQSTSVGVPAAQAAIDRFREGRTNRDPIMQRMAEVDLAYRRREEFAAQAAKRVERSEKQLAEARTRATATAKRAGETGSATDLRVAERHTRALASAETALANARRSATVAETDRALAQIRREASVAAAQRQTMRERMADAMHYPKRALAYSASYGVIDRGRELAAKAQEGAREANTQRSLNRFSGMTPEASTKLEADAAASSRKFQAATAASLVEVGREALTNLKDPGEAPKVIDQIAKMNQVLALVYQDRKRSEDATRLFSKSADQAGFAGNAAEYKKFTDAVLSGLIAAGGKDVNPSVAFSGFRNMGAAKYSLSEDAISAFMGLTDERAGQAGADVRTFIGDLTRSTLRKESKAEMADAGLRNEDGTAKLSLAKLAEKNPWEFVWSEIKPLLQKQGVDLKSSSAVTDGLRKIGFLDRGAAFAALAINKEDELRQFITKAQESRKAIADEKVQADTKRSLITSGQALESQFKNLTDRLTKPLQEPFAAVKAGLANVMAGIATGEKASGASGLALQAPNATATKLVGGLLLENVAAAASLAKDHPGVAGHIVAAGALTRAAAALTVAAGAQRAAAGLGGLAGAGGLAGPAGALGMALRFALRASLVGLGAAIALDVANAIATVIPPIKKGDALGDRKADATAPKFEDGKRSPVSFELSDTELKAIVEGVATGAEKAAARRILAGRNAGPGEGYDAQGRFIGGEKAADPLGGLDLGKIEAQIAADLTRSLSQRVESDVARQYGAVDPVAPAKAAAGEIATSGQTVFSQISTAFATGAETIASAIRNALSGGINVNVNPGGEPGGLGGGDTGAMGTGGR